MWAHETQVLSYETGRQPYSVQVRNAVSFFAKMLIFRVIFRFTEETGKDGTAKKALEKC